MGQLFFTDEHGRRWMCGWDNPTQGYYAMREHPNPDAAEEFDVMIGLGNGVSEKELWLELRKHGFFPWQEQWQQILDDRARQERPLTPLQKSVREWLDPIIEDLKC